jgi:growth factor-regulated tyrosine kinase substrate
VELSQLVDPIRSTRRSVPFPLSPPSPPCRPTHSPATRPPARTHAEQSTSDLLPAKSPLDLDAALRLADSVRSASVPPSEAALKLVTRLGHDNPNVQLLTLQLADVLVKNAGNQFLKAFASNGAGGAVNELDYLCSGTSTTRGGRPPVVNRDVQLAARQKLQEWASAFEASGRPLLSQSDLVKLYHRLRSTPNVPFPAPVDATTTAAMVDSLSAPDWSDSPYCTRCRTEFSTFNRKHHCRNCGNVFDQQCSSQSMPLPHYGITTESVRVCDACAKQIKLGKGAQVARTILEQQANSSSGAKTTMTTTRRRDEEQEDADLQRAIQASLAESTSATSASHGPVRHSPPPPAESGYHPSYASQIQSSSSEFKKEGGAKEEGEEEDPDLAAAIAASLKDLESSRPRASAPAPAPAPAQTYSDLFPSSSSDHRAPTATTSATKTATGAGTAFHLPSYDLTPVEQSHLSQFLSLSSQLDPAYPTSNDESSYRLVSEVLQPKLERSLRDARTRGEILREMEAKLSEAARLYGAGLTERVVGRQEPQGERLPVFFSPSSFPVFSPFLSGLSTSLFSFLSGSMAMPRCEFMS